MTAWWPACRLGHGGSKSGGGSGGRHVVFESWSLLRESVDLARFLMDWAVRVPVLASLASLADMIVSVASNAVHKAEIVFCRTRFISSDDTVKDGAAVAASYPRDAESSDCEEASESGLQLMHRLFEVSRIDVSDVSVIHDSFRALEPNFGRCKACG